MKEKDIAFGTYIKVLRTKLNWSSSQLAKNIGISRNWMHDIESGKGLPSAELLTKLDDIFPKAKIFEAYKKVIQK